MYLQLRVKGQCFPVKRAKDLDEIRPRCESDLCKVLAVPAHSVSWGIEHLPSMWGRDVVQS